MKSPRFSSNLRRTKKLSADRFLASTRRLALASLCALPLAAPAQTLAQAPSPLLAQASPPASAQVQPAPQVVKLTQAKLEMWPDEIEVPGNVMPWQETYISTEIGGLRLNSVLVNIGDFVTQGQVLAQLNPAPIMAELDAAKAQQLEAEATLAQAESTLARANRLAPSGGVSQQDLTRYAMQQQTASARLKATQAQVKTQELRLASTTLTAPDDGLISSRSAAEGAIVQSGSELFKLIRQGRLEWRCEVPADALLQLSVGQSVTLDSPLGEQVKGLIRQIAPTINVKTRTGLVYVDLPLDTRFKAGLMVTGSLNSQRQALSLPTSALRYDEMGAQVLTVNAGNKVEVIKVQTGRTMGDRVEITSGLNKRSKVIAKDLASLKPGERVQVAK